MVQKSFTTLQRCLATPLRRCFSTQGVQPTSALFFPGQGTQQVNMTQPWTDNFQSARIKMEEMDHVLGFSLSKLIKEGPPDVLNRTENAQPAILAMSALILEVLMEDFKVPLHEMFDYTLGHSLGEFTALAISGMLDIPTSLKLVRARGLSMRDAALKADRKASMIALVVEKGRSRFIVEKLQAFREEHDLKLEDVLCIANHNSDSQVVVAGYDDLILRFVEGLKRFDGRDPRAVRLPLSAPFHTSLMQPAQAHILKVLDDPAFSFRLPPRIKLVSNVTACELPSTQTSENENFCKRAIARQCTETVRWFESIEYLKLDKGVEKWLSIGPSMVVQKLVESSVGRGRVLHVGKIEDLEGVVKQLMTKI